MSAVMRAQGFVFPKGRGMRLLLVAAALVVACLSSRSAEASDRGKAERLYTKGLAEMHAGQDDAAIALFQQAVDADPSDIRGVYYRGLGYGKAGRYEEAARDLKAVVAADDPRLERDRLEYGYALYRLERFDEAAAELEIASKKKVPSAGEAMLLLGIVEIRRGHDEAARSDFAKVEGMDASLALQARYYQGLAAYRAGDQPVASSQFEWVQSQPGNSPFSREAGAFLDRMREGTADSGRPYRLHAGFALEYDSNVVLAPDSNTLSNSLGISNQDDGRAVFTAGGQYAIVAQPNLRFAVGYDFLQTLHFDLESYDVQTHRFGGELAWLHGPLTLGLAGDYEHSLLDEHSLVNAGDLMPWGRWDEGDFGRTEVYYRFRDRNYLLDPYSPQRDSMNHATGVRQFFSLGSRTRNIIIGYRFDSDVADKNIGKEWDYHGDQFEGGLQWDFGHDFYADAIYAYKLENYSKASGNRDDDVHTVLVRGEKKLTDYVWLIGSYIYRDNISDQNYFQYDRHIVSLGVEARY